VKVFRIARAGSKAARDAALAAFSGDGAAKYPGRWNTRGVRAVYCSERLSVACLETLVHIRPIPRVFPASVFFALEIPDDLLEEPALSRLPAVWNAEVVPRQTREFGTEFLQSGRAVGLVVPTAVIPLEKNVIINPLHPKFRVEDVKGPYPFFFDRRLA